MELFENINDLKVKTVVVLGSKPGAVLPAVKADVVLAANSSVELATLYREKYGSEIISLTPCNHFGDKDYIQNSIQKSRPDKIVILGECLQNAEHFVQHTLGLQDTVVEVLSSHTVNWKFLSTVGIGRYRILIKRILVRGPLYFFSYFIPDLFKNKEMSFLARSTGLNCILYAIHRFENLEEIIIVGVGLEEGGHFNNLGEFTDKTAQADRLVFKHWPKKRRNMLRTTDDKMSVVGSVRRWCGASLLSREQY